MLSHTDEARSQLFPGQRLFKPPDLLQIAMPMGGIGAGCICFNGYGGLQDFSIYNHPSVSALADDGGDRNSGFAVLHVKGTHAKTRLIEGPLPPEKLYDQALQGMGYGRGGFEGLPRFDQCTFTSGYPFGVVSLSDEQIPLAVEVTGWSPFVPLDDIASGAPCAILDYRFENVSPEPVTFDFSYHLSHFAPKRKPNDSERILTKSRIASPLPSGVGGGIDFYSTADPSSESFGSASLYAVDWNPRIKAQWFRGPWFDAVSVLWRELSTGKFGENDGSYECSEMWRNGGSVLGEFTLNPGDSKSVSVAIAWYFPNSYLRVGGVAPGAGDTSGASGPAWRPFYAGKWADATDVAKYVSDRCASLRDRTTAFRDALFSSTAPAELLDAVASNLAILKSPTVLRQENGNVWAWEGCQTRAGSCHGSCTHVWNYAQAMPHLFPLLERTLREQELVRSMDEHGHVQFRSALPDGPAPHNYHAAADGQLGGVMKLYRDWQISGDTEWLSRLYPLARLSLEYCIRTWDPDQRGGLFEPHHNTYDIEFWGPDGMCGTIYLGALSAMRDMANSLGMVEDAERYRALAETSAQFMASELFNGEYFYQRVQWTNLRDTSFERLGAELDESSDETLRLLKREGPKYQYGTGCLSDGVIGAWMAQLYGIETPLNRELVKSSLRSIHRHNFHADLSEHACTQRPGYAMGHEPGLLLCSWPLGGKPTLPFVYSDEVWTGIEYQVASHLIAEGLVDEGLEIVRGVRARYDGRVRNPFNEYECGSYYARALAGYALLGAYSGFYYSAVDKSLKLAPKAGGAEFRIFFSAATGYGTVSLSESGVVVDIVEGELAVDTLRVLWNGSDYYAACAATARPNYPIRTTLAAPE